VGGCLLAAHDINGPSRVFAVIDILEERLCGIIRVFTGKLDSLIIRQSLNPIGKPIICTWATISYLETSVLADMDLGVDKRTVILRKLENMSRITMLMVVTVRCSAVREENHDLMDGFRVLRQVVL
jgi:hypothetical protein